MNGFEILAEIVEVALLSFSAQSTTAFNGGLEGTVTLGRRRAICASLGRLNILLRL
jgi:hypothetical protein